MSIINRLDIENPKELFVQIDDRLSSIRVSGDDVEKLYFARVVLKQLFASLKQEKMEEDNA